MGEAPAFQFYARDFLVGTMPMTTAQVGLYIRALAYSWDAGPLTTDTDELARTLLCPVAEFRKLWPVVVRKFEQTDAGFVNRRLEQEREKQEAYRAQCAANGAKGGRPQKPKHNPSVISGLSETKPKPNPEESSASAICDLHTASAERDTAKGAVSVRAERQKYGRPLVGSPLEHRSHGWCNQRGLCLPASLYAELLGRLGGPAREKDLIAWLGATIDELTTVPGETVWVFWRSRFEAWQGSTAPTTKGARTMAAGRRIQALLDSGAELDPFGTKADARERAALAAKAGV